MMDRERQIELLENAEERTVGHVARWLQIDEVRAAFHRYDFTDDGDGCAHFAQG